MSDFGAFGDAFEGSGITEDDPAAEFLAREQDELAGLELQVDDDNFDSSQAFVDSGLDMSTPATEPVQVNGPSEPPTVSNSQHNKSVFTREEPEKIRKWREEQQKLLEQKDAEEAIKKQELQQTAKKELEEWYARYNEQIEKSKINNREASQNAEQEWVADRDTASPGQEWERIAKLCDFNPKSSRNTKDTSRMRSIILQLKQFPPVKNSK